MEKVVEFLLIRKVIDLINCVGSHVFVIMCLVAHECLLVSPFALWIPPLHQVLSFCTRPELERVFPEACSGKNNKK